MRMLRESDNSKTSTRRVMGSLVIVFSMILAGVDTFTDYIVNDTIWIAMFGGGVSMIVSTVVKGLGHRHHREDNTPPGNEDG